MSLPQMPVQISFVRPWSFRRPIGYRYLDATFVDEFFKKGMLRLSSMDAFSKHKDEARKDTEGLGVVSNVSKDGKGQSVFAQLGQGFNAYILCFSTIFSADIANAFNADSGFQINDTTAFANMIAFHIPGFNGGSEGPVHYVEQRAVNREAGRIDLEAMKLNDGSSGYDMGKMHAAIGGLAGDDLFYMKPKKYSWQVEYRILWFVHGSVTGHIDIICPEAIQYCTRFADPITNKLRPQHKLIRKGKNSRRRT